MRLLAVACGLALCGALATAAPALAGSISGTVTDASTLEPIAGVLVCASEEQPLGAREVSCDEESDVNGDYSIEDLPSGEYAVEFMPGAAGLNYLFQVWENGSTWLDAKLVSVTGDVSGIDAELSEGGEMSGRVVDASNGVPLSNVEICAEPGSLDNEEGCTVTDSAGEYTLPGLGTDSYWVSFVAPEEAEFLPQYWNGQPGILEADDLEVTIGQLTANVNAALQRAGRITGTVTDAITRAPMAGVDACAWEIVAGGQYLGPCGETDAAGHYTIKRVPAGNYYVSFGQFSRPSDSWIQWYRCMNGPPATTVAVTTGLTTSGIDAGLRKDGSSPCEPQLVGPGPAVVKPTKHLKCKKGFHKKKAKGKTRCVKKHRKRQRSKRKPS